MKGNVYPEIVPLKVKAASFATKIYVKRKRSIVHSKETNLFQEAESNEDEVFKIYHQRVIGGKTAPYVANVKIDKGNVALLVFQIIF